MNIDQLKTFLAVADEMSISGAADRLGTSQPVVSRIIKRLEGELKAPLFDRLPRGVALSPFGKTLYAEAQLMLSAHRRTLESFQALKGEGRTHLRIGAGATWLEERLPVIIADFTNKNPGVRLDAMFVPRFEVVEALLMGRIDLGLAQFGLSPAASDDIEYEELLRDRLVVVGRKNHPMKGQLTKEKLVQELRWANTASATAEERLKGLAKRFRVGVPNVHVRCHSMSNVLEIVRNTDLAALAPEFLVENNEDLEVLWREFGLTLSKGILVPRNATLSLGARMFRSHLRTTFGSASEE